MKISTKVASDANLDLSERKWCKLKRGVAHAIKRASAKAERRAARQTLRAMAR